MYRDPQDLLDLFKLGQNIFLVFMHIMYFMEIYHLSFYVCHAHLCSSILNLHSTAESRKCYVQTVGEPCYAFTPTFAKLAWDDSTDGYIAVHQAQSEQIFKNKELEHCSKHN
jgi:hypothetical protein